MSAREYLVEYALEGVPGPRFVPDLYHKITRKTIGDDLPIEVKAVITQAIIAFKRFHESRSIAYYESRDLDTGWWTVKTVVRGTDLWEAAKFKKHWRWDTINKDGGTFEDAIRESVRRIIYASMTKLLREAFDNGGEVAERVAEHVESYSELNEADTFARDSRVADYMREKTGKLDWCFAEDAPTSV